MSKPERFDISNDSAPVCDCDIDECRQMVGVWAYDNYGDAPALISADDAIELGRALVAMGEWLKQQERGEHE